MCRILVYNETAGCETGGHAVSKLACPVLLNVVVVVVWSFLVVVVKMIIVY